jgi:hypothetical protein
MHRSIVRTVLRVAHFGLCSHWQAWGGNCFTHRSLTHSHQNLIDQNHDCTFHPSFGSVYYYFAVHGILLFFHWSIILHSVLHRPCYGWFTSRIVSKGNWIENKEWRLFRGEVLCECSNRWVPTRRPSLGSVRCSLLCCPWLRYIDTPHPATLCVTNSHRCSAADLFPPRCSSLRSAISLLPPMRCIIPVSSDCLQRIDHYCLDLFTYFGR